MNGDLEVEVFESSFGSQFINLEFDLVVGLVGQY